MEDYKPNSHKSKEEPKARALEKKVEKVISGKARSKKKNEVQKFASAFIKEDLNSISSYIITDVLVPATKKTILDIVKAILGESGTSSRSATTASKVSYRSYYDKDDDRKRDYTAPARGGFDYDDIVFEHRGDAEIVLETMEDIVKGQYGIVSVGDLYDLANVTTDNYTVNSYGWTDLRGAKVIPVRDGYVIKLPRALPLK